MVMDKSSVLKEYIDILNRLLILFVEAGGELAKQGVEAWKATRSDTVLEEQGGLSEAQKKRQDAKSRQAAIMAQFAKAQQTFSSNFEEELDELEQGEEEALVDSSAGVVGASLWEFPSMFL